MSETDDARDQQFARVSHEAQRFGDLLQKGNAAIADWSYRPPESDDWRQWKGVTKWCAIERIYRWLCAREAYLRLGGGPCYCPAHGETKPVNGWKARNCLDCDWDAYLYDEALAMARDLGKAWVVSGQKQRAAMAS